jgi:hypothetical protein
MASASEAHDTKYVETLADNNEARSIEEPNVAADRLVDSMANRGEAFPAEEILKRRAFK